ncbi:MAG: UDP-2,3-diacylglucosamine diphosphatase LpxI [Phycisphaerales bacterium]|nr:UDP-2,3-diacylglucosamine diphosphatase LpxI [Phycisphaerales bacterium]
MTAPPAQHRHRSKGNYNPGVDDSRPIGLIAGEGRLPVVVAEGMQAAGRPVACVAFRGHADDDLESCCDRYRTVGLYRMGQWLRTLKRWGATEAVMVGRVSKARMHDPLRLVRQIPDLRSALLWYRRLRHDRRNATVLAAIADELDRGGIRLLDSTTFIEDHLASEGVLGRTQPTDLQKADIAFGWPLLTRTVDMDIGQSIAVREGDVIAVEALEGTTGMIERAGGLCRRSGWTLLKTARKDHDRRADVPTIGVQTITELAAAGAGCIAIGTGQVILIDRPAVVEAADRAGIAIVGIADDGS